MKKSYRHLHFPSKCKHRIETYDYFKYLCRVQETPEGFPLCCSKNCPLTRKEIDDMNNTNNGYRYADSCENCLHHSVDWEGIREEKCLKNTNIKIEYAENRICNFYQNDFEE